jgi:drug/metabolite transporter (DMT)-like permease
MNARSLVWTFATLVSWGIWAILGKEIGNALTASQSQVLSTIGLVPILAALALRKQPPSIGNRRRGIALAFGSGVLSCIGNIPFYAALGAQATMVVPLTSLFPLVTVLLAVVLLNERLNRVQVCGVVLSLAAIYLLSPSDEHGHFSPWVLLALISITLWGVTGLLQKMATNEISGSESALWFLIAFAVVGLCMLVYEPLPRDVTPETWMLVMALGFALALGNFTILLAFAAGGKASIIMPLTALYPVISIPIAIQRYDETMDWRKTLGAVFALAGVVTLSYESRPNDAPGSSLPTGSP